MQNSKHDIHFNSFNNIKSHSYMAIVIKTYCMYIILYLLWYDEVFKTVHANLNSHTH